MHTAKLHGNNETEEGKKKVKLFFKIHLCKVVISVLSVLP